MDPEKEASGNRKSGSRTEKERQLRSDHQALSRGHGRALHTSDPPPLTTQELLRRAWGGVRGTGCKS